VTACTTTGSPDEEDRFNVLLRPTRGVDGTELAKGTGHAASKVMGILRRCLGVSAHESLLAGGSWS
jgi:hypothetical protein